MPEKTFSQPNDAGITGSFAASSLQAGAVHGGDLERVVAGRRVKGDGEVGGGSWPVAVHSLPIRPPR